MSKTLEKIANHYQKAIAGDLEKIRVEEWDMDIYCKRTYAFKDEAKMIELQSQGKTVEALVESLIVKALDKDGKRIFFDADRVLFVACPRTAKISHPSIPLIKFPYVTNFTILRNDT